MAVLLVVAFVVLAVRVGSSESAQVTLRSPTAWLATAVNGTLVQANAIDGSVLSRVEATTPGHSIAAVNTRGGVVVLDRNDSIVRRVDAGSLTIDREFGTDPDGRSLALFGSDDAIFLADADEVHVLDPTTLSPLQTVEVGAFISRAVVDSTGTLWGIDDTGTKLHEITATTAQSRGVGPGESLLLGHGVAYLASASNGDVRPLRGGGLGAGCLPNNLGEATIASGPDVEDPDQRLVVIDPERSQLVAVDLSTAACDTVVLSDTVGRVGSMAVGDGFAYVVDAETGSLWAISLDSAELGTARRLGVGRASAQVELFARSGSVWFNEVDGGGAAVLDDGVLIPIDKVALTDATAEVGISEEGGDVLLVPEDPAGIAVAAALGAAAQGASDEGEGVGGGAIGGVAVQELVEPTPSDDQAPTEPVDPEALDANFEYSPGSVVRVGDVVTFADRSTGQPTSWSWTFGDGTASDGPETSHSWGQEGVYAVTLTVDRGDQSDTETLQVTVLPIDSIIPPVASFDFSSSTVEVGQSVEFTSTATGAPTSLLWNFGDGASASGRSTRHAWSQPGSYPVTLTASNRIGSDRATAIITVVTSQSVSQPTITIAASSTVVAPGAQVELTALVTGNPTSVTWNLGDGTSDTGLRIRHGYALAGIYTVSATAANSAGSVTATLQITVELAVQPPVARFIFDVSSPVAGQLVTFTSTSTNSPTTVTWDFGDGTTATGTSVQHRFATARQYRVVLTASNAGGSNSTSALLVVGTGTVAPRAAFTVSPAVLHVNQPVQLTDASTGAPVSWSWTISDGRVSTAQSPAVVFPTVGTYLVTLTVQNSAGADTTSSTIQVLPPVPSADFRFTPAVPRVGNDVRFEDRSTGNPTSWLWDFGDGFTSTNRNPAHTFVTAGTFPVSLTVANAGGTHTRTINVVVSPPAPNANFTMTPSPANVNEVVVFSSAGSTGIITQHFWEFGDGTTSTLANPAHIYASASTYSVRLTVTGPGGTDVQTRSLTVRVPRVQASFTAAPTTVLVGDPVTFTDTSTGPVNAWAWNFGGAGTAATQHASFSFATPGSYSVTLTVTGSGSSGTSTSTPIVITVNPRPPVASFTFLPLAPTLGETVTFTDTSTGSITAWSWTFGDGIGTSTSQSPSYLYTAAGSFTVTLTVTGPGGSNTITAVVTVTSPPPPPGP